MQEVYLCLRCRELTEVAARLFLQTQQGMVRTFLCQACCQQLLWDVEGERERQYLAKGGI